MTEQENTTTRLTAEEARRIVADRVPDEWLDKTYDAIRRAAESGEYCCYVPEDVQKRLDLVARPVHRNFAQHYDEAGFRVFTRISADGVKRTRITWGGD